MIDDNCRSLVLHFVRESIAYPGKDETGLFLNANVLDLAAFDWRERLDCVQGNRATFLTLDDAGFSAAPVLGEKQYPFALLIAGRHKRLNEINLARAYNAVLPGGHIVVAGAKTDGIASLRKYAASLCDIDDSLAKYHCVVFWMRRGNDPIEMQETVFEPTSGYKTKSGMFSAEKRDRASVMLTENFDNQISGNVADLGAGWGYLSGMALEKSRSIRQIDLYEADWEALEAAKHNLKDRLDGVRLDFFWFDVTGEKISRKYDWILMNPPFHAGRKGDPDIGKKFIEVAHGALSPSGRLLMVANRHLPYETTLNQRFRNVQSLMDRNGFKVLLARK